MERREWVTQLRGAVYRRDGVVVVALAQDPGRPPGVLQLLGDGLAVALGQRVEGVDAVEADCVAGLRDRGWAGDSELAEQLEALAGRRPVPMLRPLAVDLDELAGILEGDPVYSGGAVDLQSGQVWHQSTIEDLDDDAPDFEDPERWLWVHTEGSRDSYRDMVRFIETVDGAEKADMLSIAVEGRGAFRRFKDVLSRWPDELDRWFEFAGERQRGRARAWLADAGYRVHTADGKH